MCNGAVTLCNLSRNFVASEVPSEIAKYSMPGNHKVTQHFFLREASHEVESGSNLS